MSSYIQLTYGMLKNKNRFENLKTLSMSSFESNET